MKQTRMKTMRDDLWFSTRLCGLIVIPMLLEYWSSPAEIRLGPRARSMRAALLEVDESVAALEAQKAFLQDNVDNEFFEQLNQTLEQIVQTLRSCSRESRPICVWEMQDAVDQIPSELREFLFEEQLGERHPELFHPAQDRVTRPEKKSADTSLTTGHR